jgi:hypothetical protein
MNEELNQYLQECRELFGHAPRKFKGWFPQVYHSPYGPFWCRPAWCFTDGLNPLFREMYSLLQNGVVVWGHLVQANSLLFSQKPPHYSAPADIIFCPNDQSNVSIFELEEISHNLYALKGTVPNDPELLPFAQHITNELTRIFGWRVPQNITPETVVFSTTYFFAKHLPKGYLAHSWFPLVVDPFPPHYAVVLPSRYWSDSLRQMWKAKG